MPKELVNDRETHSASAIDWRAVRCGIVLENSRRKCSGIAFGVHRNRIKLHLKVGPGELGPGESFSLRSSAPWRSQGKISCQILAEETALNSRGNCTSVFEASLDGPAEQIFDGILPGSQDSPAVLMVGFDPMFLAELAVQHKLVAVPSADEAIDFAHAAEIGCMAIGPLLKVEESRDLLHRLNGVVPDGISHNIVTGVGSFFDSFQDCVDEDQIYYISRQQLSVGQTSTIIASAVNSYLSCFQFQTLRDLNIGTLATGRILELCKHLQVDDDALRISRIAADACREATRSERASCLLFDRTADTLSTGEMVSGELMCLSASSGLAGYIARTGEDYIHVESLADDPRVDLDTDLPGGAGDERIIARAIKGFDGNVIGVLLAARAKDSIPYSLQDETALTLASEIGCAPLRQIELRRKLESLLAGEMMQGPRIFSQEALDYQGVRWTALGDVLRGTPAWLKIAHWAVLVGLLLFVAASCTLQVRQYVDGPAVLRKVKPLVLSATVAGTVARLDVVPGAQVVAGERVAVIDPNPNPHSASNSTVLASTSGVVTEVLVHNGQFVKPNDPLVSINPTQLPAEMVALIPRSASPYVAPGKTITLRMNGRPAMTLRVASVTSDLADVGKLFPKEGEGQASSSPPTNHPIIVRAPVESSLGSDDAASGEVEVQAGSTRMLFLLAPHLQERIEKLRR